MIKRKKANPIWTIISLGFLGLCTTACDSGELPGKEKDQANIELRFAASISDSPSTKTINNPDIIQGAAFPDGTHTFGMFITNENGTALKVGSEDNMKSILVRVSRSEDTWSYTDKNDSPLSLVANHGQRINIIGYYPWTADATADVVPFDFTGEASNWKDLLYLSSPSGTEQVLDAHPIALTFSHAYCWVTVKLSKLTDKSNVSVKSVSLENSYSTLQRIMNKGSINPKTGAVVNGTPGPLVIGCTLSVDIPLEGATGTPALQFNFLVPPFMRDDIQDSDIVIRVATEIAGETEVLSFPLNKVYLNNANSDQYGFEKGKHNTYNIIYNNSEMVLSLSDWQETLIEDSKLGGGSAGVTPNKATFQYFTAVDKYKLKLGNHINHSYLGEVAENNNGNYVTVELPSSGTMFEKWTPFMQADPFYPELDVAKGLAAGGGEVPWKDPETGVLTAKQACSEFREGGYKDWRLPRASEIYIITYPDNFVGGTSKVYWTATEYDATQSFATRIISENGMPVFYPARTSKEDTYYVRCVRDTDKPKPTI